MSFGAFRRQNATVLCHRPVHHIHLPVVGAGLETVHESTPSPRNVILKKVRPYYAFL